MQPGAAVDVDTNVIREQAAQGKLPVIHPIAQCLQFVRGPRLPPSREGPRSRTSARAHE